VWVSVTEFEVEAFNRFDRKWFCFIAITLLLIQYENIVLMLFRVTDVETDPRDYSMSPRSHICLWFCACGTVKQLL
jgi:hypothetical protein